MIVKLTDALSVVELLFLFKCDIYAIIYKLIVSFLGVFYLTFFCGHFWLFLSIPMVPTLDK